jgi:RNA polymerase sigma-70 factor, ECF subfamily
MGFFGLGRKTKEIDEFQALIEQHLDGMFRVAMRYTRDRTQAEDLVHDTVVRALRFQDRFERGTNFKAWVYTILTHTFIHKYRRGKREREILEGATQEDVASQLRSEASRELAASPENAYVEQLLSDDVVKALDSLPEDFRTVVVLCDLEGLAYKDIAEAVNVPVGTVMSRLYRGRRLLEQKLAGLALERGIIKSDRFGDRQANDEGVLDLQTFRRRKSG